QTAYALFIATHTGRPIAFTGLITLVLVFVARQFASYLSADHSSKPKRVRIPTQLIGFAVGVSLAFIVATFWAGVAQAILWKGQTPKGAPGQQIIDSLHPAPPQVSLSKDNRIVVSPPAESVQPAAEVEPNALLTSAAFILALVVNLLTGKTLTFLNLSS